MVVRGFEVYVHGKEKRLVQAAKRDRVEDLRGCTCFEKKTKKEKRFQDWEEKALHGQYLRQTKEVRSEQNWVWLQNWDLKREADSLIVAARNQSIRTNLVKLNIYKSQKDTLRRLCKKAGHEVWIMF